jgi:tetratricopeptide (TPR) repeat protein
MTLALVALGLAALSATDPCASVTPAPSPDRSAAADYRAVAEAERAAGGWETAVAAWRLAAALDPDDRRAPEALAEFCREGGAKSAPRDPVQDAIQLLDAGKYREAAEQLRMARRTGRDASAALLEGICRYELGEDAEAALLLREAEADPAHRDSARLYLGLVALRAGSATEAAALFDAARSNPSFASLASDLARSARWDGPLVLSLLAEGGWDSNVGLVGSQGAGGGMASSGDAVAGLSAVALARPLGANGPFLRAAGSLQKYARLDQYDFTSWEAAAGGRFWRSGTGVTAEYSFADRTLGGHSYLQTHRVLAAGAVGLGPVELSASWWGRWENYAATFDPYSGFAQRAEARASVALGSRARLGAGWILGRDDTDTSSLGWTEQGPRADLRVVLGPTTRLAVEAGGVLREYHGTGGAPITGRLTERILDGVAAFEWDLGRRVTARFSLLARLSNSNYDPFDYTKVVPSAAIGVMMTP